MAMRLKNDRTQFGLIAILLHWLIAILTIGLFALGLWMVDLDYYHAWYQRAPWLHKGFGMTLFTLLLLRMMWRWITPPPQALDSHKAWEQISAKAVHGALNFLIVLISISGYLIVTAKGDPLSVFGLVDIPASLTGIENLEDLAGEIHAFLACFVILLASVHALAACKHHLIDKDRTLRRMLGL